MIREDYSTAAHGQSQIACDPLVEQYFPQEMSWYASETPPGPITTATRWIRQNPRAGFAIAVGAGVLLGILTTPASRNRRARRLLAGRAIATRYKK